MKLEAVGKRYGPRQPWVVRDVSITVTPGRLIRLEGRNGSGKSTLLRVAAGVLAPTAGRVTGRPGVGYVPERFPPALPFSGRDYLMHLGRVHGLRGVMLTARVDEYLTRFGAAEYAGTPLQHLSKGMCQKIAVGQALLARPGLLVLDEAWTGLDQAARDELDTVVAERLADGGRVMFVDHDRRRLAGLVGERWQIGRSQVTVVKGPDPGAVTAPEQQVVIEFAGASPGLTATLREMPGVRAVAEEPQRTVVRAVRTASDDVLRAALAREENMHVTSVRDGGRDQP